MNGYMIHHEAQINRQADALCSLAREYRGLIEEAEALTRMPGWDSPAAEVQRETIKAILRDAYSTARMLQQIGAELYAFTASHKTWLEDIVDAITEGADQ